MSNGTPKISASILNANEMASWLFSWPTVSATGAMAGILFVLWAAYRTNYPNLANIPEAPGSYPLVGHLPFLGGRLKENDANIFSRWSRQLAAGIFQVKLGYQRTVIVSSWAAMEEIFCHQKQLHFGSRAPSGILGSHWHRYLRVVDESTDQKCRIAAVSSWEGDVPGYYRLIEPNSVKFIKTLYDNGRNGKLPLETYPWLRQIMFDLALHITYGARIGEFDDELSNRLLNSLNVITESRGSTASYRHYVPLLRIWPEKKTKLIAAAEERDECVKVLYDQYTRKATEGKAPDCLVSSLIADKLTPEELHGTCMSILQAAPDTVSSSTYQCLAWLCTPEGQIFQEDCLDGILKAYGGDRDQAWDMAFREEKVPLITSLYKETIRFYATSAFNMRSASKDLPVFNTMIPKGMAVTMNIRGVNHDPEHYGADALAFNPRRFLKTRHPCPI